MTASVRERILQNVQSTLGQVTVPNGYAFTLARVERVDFTDWTQGPFPMALIHEPDDTYDVEKNRGSTTVLHVNMALDLLVMIRKPAAEKATPINALIQDVQTAMLEDTTRGGLAIWTEPVRTSVSVMDESQALSAARISWLIYYRHRRNDVTQAS